MIAVSVGEKAPIGKTAPKADDIKKIQGLLRKVYGASAPAF